MFATAKNIVTLACAAAGLFLVDCGSRTGLDVGAVATFSNGPDAGDAGKDADAAALPCIPGSQRLAKAKPAVLFVIDRSASMGDRLGTGRSSRWQILTNALSEALPPVDQTMEIGALLYPQGGSSRDLSCSVPADINLSPAIGHVSPLLQLMRDNAPGGSTPTADALDLGARKLLGFRAASTARAIVLATDGAPNCNTSLDTRTCRCVSGGPGCRTAAMCLDDTRTVDRITSYARAGLPTYVIGIQVTGERDFADVLDAMAIAGGRPQTTGARKFYAASSEDELTSALVTIREQVSACTYLTTSVPDARGSIHVTLNGRELPYDPTGAQGWMWGNKENGEIVLVGVPCTQARTTDVQVVADVTCDEGDASVDARADGKTAADAQTDVGTDD